MASNAPTAAALLEHPVPGVVPRFAVPGWAESGLDAGITGRGSASGFDLGLWSAKPVGEVMERWRAFRNSFDGYPGVVLGNQVHGARVMIHEGGPGWRLMEAVDGHVTSAPGLLLTVTVADCVPVYLFEPRTRVIGLLHAGWRGAAAGILDQGIRAMRALGAAVEEVRLHCGVGICGACYEVGAEVFAACGRSAPQGGRGQLDLREVLLEQASGLGIGHCSVSSDCSAHNQDRFFSHRRSQGSDGRMVAYLGLRP